MCKQILMNEPTPRNCRAKEFADGYCRRHHPDVVEAELISTLRYEKRQLQQADNRAVGAYLRIKHPSIFEQMRTEIDAMMTATGDISIRK